MELVEAVNTFKGLLQDVIEKYKRKRKWGAAKIYVAEAHMIVNKKKENMHAKVIVTNTIQDLKERRALPKEDARPC